MADDADRRVELADIAAAFDVPVWLLDPGPGPIMNAYDAALAETLELIRLLGDH